MGDNYSCVKFGDFKIFKTNEVCYRSTLKTLTNS